MAVGTKSTKAKNFSTQQQFHQQRPKKNFPHNNNKRTFFLLSSLPNLVNVFDLSKKTRRLNLPSLVGVPFVAKKSPQQVRMEAQQQNPPSVNPDYHGNQQQPQQPQQQQSAPPPPEGYAPYPHQQQQYSQYPPQQQQQQHPPQQQQQQPQGYPSQQSLYPQMCGYPQPQQGPEMAVIVCYSCGHENIVPLTVLSLVCARCGAPNERPAPPPQNTDKSFNPNQGQQQQQPPPAFVPEGNGHIKEAVKEEIQEIKNEIQLPPYLSDYQPNMETKFEIPDTSPPFFFPSLREWRWKIMVKGVLEFELLLKYEAKHCQEDLSLIRRGKTIAIATFSFGKYKIQTPQGESVAQLTLNKAFLGGGDGVFVIDKPHGPSHGSLRVHIARRGTHKLFEGERMVARWAFDHSVLTIEVEEKTDAALLLFAVLCFERWG